MTEHARQTLLVVTGNPGKAREIGEITGWPVEAVEIDLPEIQSLDVAEVAAAKVQAAYERVGKPVVVDDTGMSLDALGGLPGALVAWFLDTIGPEGIWRLLEGHADRRASVVTCIGYHDGVDVHVFSGEVRGAVPIEMRGAGGFGYDPIFVPDGHDITYAEMSAEEKNTVSMRKIALERFRDYLTAQE